MFGRCHDIIPNGHPHHLSSRPTFNSAGDRLVAHFASAVEAAQLLAGRGELSLDGVCFQAGHLLTFGLPKNIISSIGPTVRRLCAGGREIRTAGPCRKGKCRKRRTRPPPRRVSRSFFLSM